MKTMIICLGYRVVPKGMHLAQLVLFPFFTFGFHNRELGKQGFGSTEVFWATKLSFGASSALLLNQKPFTAFTDSGADITVFARRD